MGGKVRRASTTKATGGSLISDDKLREMYASMLQCRLLTEHLKGNGYKGSMGQEAIACGCVIHLRPEDTIVVTPRNSLPRLVKGTALGELVKESQQRPARNSPKSFDMNCSLALDAAVRSKKKKSGNVVVMFADKATVKRSSWKQALEMAGRAKLPIIFVVENNPWPGPGTRPARMRARSAEDYPLPVFTVDANDVVAVYRVAYESLERLREDPCPVLMYAEGYHLPHERDPLLHMERYLKAKKLFSQRWKKQVEQRFSRQLGSYLRASGAVAND